MSIDPTTALTRLRAGNTRYANGSATVRFTERERAAIAVGQEPWAVIVGCSDSRVPVEAVFDVEAGDLFVVRTAGHVLAQASLASIRFAIEKLGVGTVVVLGHEDCGAVSAALSDDSPEWLAPILNHINVSNVSAADAPHDADPDKALLAAAVDHHVLETVVELREWVAGFRDASTAPLIAGAAYKLTSGEVHWLE